MGAAMPLPVPRSGPHHAGLERAVRVIDRLDLVAAQEFVRVTGAVFQGEGPLHSWSGSRLNQSGCPLEFSFGPLAPELRYSMELGRPDTAPGTRLGLAWDVLDALGAMPARGGATEAFAALQQGQPLGWGAWLAARHPCGDGSAGPTRYKVYAELGARDDSLHDTLFGPYLGTARLPAFPFARAVMVGASPGAQRCEFYFELGRCTPTLSSLRGLLGHVGLAGKLDDLVTQVGAFDFRHGRHPHTLPRAHYGVSYSVLPQRKEPVFSLHVFAHDLSGGDAWIRCQALAASGARGDAMPVYQALTAPMAGKRAGADFHNMITFSVGEGIPPGWLASVSPPPDPVLDY